MPADSTLRAVIVGCGLIAGGYDYDRSSSDVRTHAKAYRLQSMTKLVAVADKDAGQAQAFAAAWDIPKHYTDFDEMLVTETPDIVSICTPDETHVAMLKACLKHPSIRAVWCEKPLATDVEEATMIVNAYEKTGVSLAVNYQRRWNMEMHRIKQAIRNGELGEIQKIVVHYTKGICHNGSHAVDLIIDWLGLPDSIQSLASHIDFLDEDPTVDAHLSFGNAEVYLMGLDENSYSIFEIDVLGTQGRVKVTESGLATEWYLRQDDCRNAGYFRLHSLGVERTLGQDLAISYVLHDIVEAVSTGKQVRSNGASALATLKVCRALAMQAKRQACSSSLPRK